MRATIPSSSAGPDLDQRPIGPIQVVLPVLRAAAGPVEVLVTESDDLSISPLTLPAPLHGLAATRVGNHTDPEQAFKERIGDADDPGDLLGCELATANEVDHRDSRLARSLSGDIHG